MLTTITTTALKKLVWPKGHTSINQFGQCMSDTVKLNFAKAGRAKRKVWIKNLIRDFADAHDFNPSATIVVNYVCTPEGCQELAKWLIADGFTVAYWEFKPYVEQDNEGRKHTMHVGFGLDFKLNCERFVQYKLTNGQDDDEN